MYYSCEQCYKPITIQYYIVDCASWTLLDLGTNWTYMLSEWNSFVCGGLTVIPLSIASSKSHSSPSHRHSFHIPHYLNPTRTFSPLHESSPSSSKWPHNSWFPAFQRAHKLNSHSLKNKTREDFESITCFDLDSLLILLQLWSWSHFHWLHVTLCQVVANQNPWIMFKVRILPSGCLNTDKRTKMFSLSSRVSKLRFHKSRDARSHVLCQIKKARLQQQSLELGRNKQRYVCVCVCVWERERERERDYRSI